MRTCDATSLNPTLLARASGFRAVTKARSASKENPFPFQEVVYGAASAKVDRLFHKRISGPPK
jgi:hypothetical protein